MADVALNTETNNPKELMGQGIRAFVLQDFNSAVAALSKACELLQSEHGDDTHDSLADVYLYYGKSLLGLSRDASEPLGDAVPKHEESDEDEGVDSAETESGDEKAEDEKESMETENAENEANDAADKNENDEEKENAAEKENGEAAAGDKKNNGTGEEGAESAEDKPEDDEPSDLQLAWEVLELAKKIYTRQGDSGKKNLAETLIVLGEISLESENFEAAIVDIKEGLEIQKSLFGKDSRTVAESCYKLGVAYSTDSKIDNAIQSFKEALEYLNNRIVSLEKEEKKEGAQEEIREIKSLIPDVEDKIADMKTYKDEAVKKLVSAVTSQKLEGSSSGASSSSSSSAPINNISHLVKRKRKIDEIAEQKEEGEVSPAKKPNV